MTESTPDTSGGVEISVFSGTTQFALVQDSARRLVLAGFVSENNAPLSASSTTEVLVYYALGGPFHPTDVRTSLIDGIRQIEGFDSLVALVQDQIQTHGYLLMSDAISHALTEIGSRIAISQSRATRGTKVEPSAYDSGIVLDTLVDGELKITNNYLRRGKIWLEKTGFKTNSETNRENTLLKTLDLAVPSRYGGWAGTVADLFQGNYTWSPVTMPTEAVPLAPANALETSYRLTVIGPGYLEGDLGKLSPEHRDEFTVIHLKAILLDYVLPLIANVLIPLKGEQLDEFLDFIDGNGAISDIINLIRQTLPDVVSKLNEGQYREALYGLWNSAVTTNTIIPLTSALLIGYGQRAGLTFAGTALEIDEKISSAISPLGKVDLFFSLVDNFIAAHDYDNSKKASIFDITTTKTKITLVPDAAKLSPKVTTNIRAVIQDQPSDAVYTYEWSVSPTSNYFLMDADQKSTDKSPGGILTSKYDKVFIGSLVTSSGSATVRCKVTRVDNGRQELGESTVTITFDNTKVFTSVTFHIHTQMLTLTHPAYAGGLAPSVDAYLSLARVKNARAYVVTGLDGIKGQPSARTILDSAAPVKLGSAPTDYYTGNNQIVEPETHKWLLLASTVNPVQGGYRNAAEAQAFQQSVVDRYNQELGTRTFTCEVLF